MSTPESKLVPLPNQFVQMQLGGLRDLVDHHREDGGIVQFDAKDLERIDGAAVQFLMLVAKLQEKSEQDVLVINAPDLIDNALSDMGLEDLISTTGVDEQIAA